MRTVFAIQGWGIDAWHPRIEQADRRKSGAEEVTLRSSLFIFFPV